MRWIQTFLLSLILGSPAIAEELRFDVGMRGVRAAQMVIQGDVDGSRYAVSARVQGTGLIGSFVEIDYAGQSRGQVRRGRLRSASVTLDDRMGDERGVTSMRWQGGVPQITASPGFPREPYDIDASSQRGAIDPLTALFDVLRTQPEAGLCNWRADMFDGRRASRMSIGAARPVEGGVRCDAEYRRIAGFEPEEMTRTRFPFHIIYEPAGNGMMRAVEMRAATKYGDAVLRRR